MYHHTTTRPSSIPSPPQDDDDDHTPDVEDNNNNRHCHLYALCLHILIPPKKNSPKFPINCAALACVPHCAHGDQPNTDEFLTCAAIKSLLSRRVTSTEDKGDEKEWKDKYHPMIVVPSYSFRTNVFHFAQAMVQVFHTSTLLPASPATEGPMTILFRGSDPRHYGPWHTGLQNALLRYAKLIDRVEIDTFYEEDVAFNHSGLLTADVMKDRPMTVCSDRTILLGHRSQTNMWPFAGGNYSLFWPFTKGRKPKLTYYGIPALSFMCALQYSRISHCQTTV